MCELLINISVAENIKRYDRGMVVDVFENGYLSQTGRETSKQYWIAEGRDAAQWPGQGKFVIVKIPSVPADKAKGLLEHQEEDDLGNPLVDVDGNPIMYRRRRWTLLFNNIPAAIRNTLIADGEITVTVSQIRNYLKRIRDNAQFIGLD